MSTYTALQTRVQGIVIDLPSMVTASVPTLILEAIRKLQTMHDFKVCEAVTDVLTTTLQTRTLAAVPSDWLKPRGLPYLITEQGRVREIGYTEDRAAAEREWGSTAGGEQDNDTLDGPPRLLLRGEATDELGTTSFEVYPFSDGLSLYADGEYRIRVPYHKLLTPLSTGASTNWLTINATEWIVYQAASDAFLLNWDEERGALWAQRAANSLKDVILRDKKERLGAITHLRVSPNVHGRRVGRGDYDC